MSGRKWKLDVLRTHLPEKLSECVCAAYAAAHKISI